MPLRRVDPLLGGLAALPALPGLLDARAAQAQAAMPLASWNDGPPKQAILDFIRATTDPSSKDFAPPEERGLRERSRRRGPAFDLARPGCGRSARGDAPAGRELRRRHPAGGGGDLIGRPPFGRASRATFLRNQTLHSAVEFAARPRFVASFRWQRKAEDWQAIASLAPPPPLHRWAILTAASASDCETRSRRWSSATKGNETEMSHAPGVQANSTGEWGGGAVSFATKEEAIAYIVSLAPRGTSIFDVPVVEGGDPAASPEEIADLIAPAPIACAPWLTPIGASAAKDVLSRNGLDDWTTAMRSQRAGAGRLKARANGRAVTNPHSW